VIKNPPANTGYEGLILGSGIPPGGGCSELDMIQLIILKEDMMDFILVISFRNNSPAEK